MNVVDPRIRLQTELITSDCLAAADASWMKSISLNYRSSASPIHLFNERRIATIIQLPASFLSIKYRFYYLPKIKSVYIERLLIYDYSTFVLRVEKRDIYHIMHSNHDEKMCQCLSLVDPTQAKPVFAIEYEYVFEVLFQCAIISFQDISYVFDIYL